MPKVNIVQVEMRFAEDVPAVVVRAAKARLHEVAERLGGTASNVKSVIRQEDDKQEGTKRCR